MKSGLEAALERDRLVVMGAMALLTALAWFYLVWLAGHMAMPAENAAMPMSMPGMDMTAAMAPALRSPDLSDLLFAFVMWAVMMVGMMAPSVAPTILLYARVGRQAAAQQKPFASSAWFAGGYFLAWTAFSFMAALVQLALTSAALLTPMLKSANDGLGAGVLLAAGAYQWSPWKSTCLTHCRSTLLFIQRQGGFKPAPGASLMLGLRHGLYCIGCCWALMLLLLVGGVMNIAWIAGLAILVLAEKLTAKGEIFSRLAGAASIAGGLVLLYRSFFAG